MSVERLAFSALNLGIHAGRVNPWAFREAVGCMRVGLLVVAGLDYQVCVGLSGSGLGPSSKEVRKQVMC